jgi:hypothetical protein
MKLNREKRNHEELEKLPVRQPTHPFPQSPTPSISVYYAFISGSTLYSRTVYRRLNPRPLRFQLSTSNFPLSENFQLSAFYDSLPPRRVLGRRRRSPHLRRLPRQKILSAPPPRTPPSSRLTPRANLPASAPRPASRWRKTSISCSQPAKIYTYLHLSTPIYT